jgi:hypothetical protein
MKYLRKYQNLNETNQASPKIFTIDEVKMMEEVVLQYLKSNSFLKDFLRETENVGYTDIQIKELLKDYDPEDGLIEIRFLLFVPEEYQGSENRSVYGLNLKEMQRFLKELQEIKNKLTIYEISLMPDDNIFEIFMLLDKKTLHTCRPLGKAKRSGII